MVSLVCSGMFPKSWTHPRWPGPGRRTWSRSHQRRMQGWMRHPGCPALWPRPVRLARRKTLLTAQGTATPICCPFQCQDASQQVLGCFVLGSRNLRMCLDLKLETLGSQKWTEAYFEKMYKGQNFSQPLSCVISGFLCSFCAQKSQPLTSLWTKLQRSQQLQQCLLSAVRSPCSALSYKDHLSAGQKVPQAQTTPCRIAVLWLDEMFWVTSRDRVLNLLLSSHVQRLPI